MTVTELPSAEIDRTTDLPPADEWGLRLLVCSAIFAVLVGWAVLWPHTGDGDAILHYLNARDGLHAPADLLGAWARWGSKLALLVPAQFGVLPARITMAATSCLLAWQTMRLADDLRLPRAVLAGPLVILQPLVFALAGDTMTEIPMALGLVVAVRAWTRAAGEVPRRGAAVPRSRARHPDKSSSVLSRLAAPLAGRVEVRDPAKTSRTRNDVRPGLFTSASAGRATQAGPLNGETETSDAAFHVALALLSCAVVSMLPTVRPEGFFFCALWGAMLANEARRRRSWVPLAVAPVLATGTLLWVLACWAFTSTHDPLYFVHVWSWPAHSYAYYARGSLLYHFERWPEYCGPALFPLFLLGLWPSLRREMRLPWAVFGLVFVLHTILFWGHWFASDGLMRILGCVSPVTATVCLHGWNAAADGMTSHGWSAASRRRVGTGALVAAAVTVAVYYGETPVHYQGFAIREACAFIRSRHLLADAPAVVLGDPVAAAELNLPPKPANWMANTPERDEQVARMRREPVGTVGVWDNQHAAEWFNVPIEELPSLGYETLYTVRQTVVCHPLKWVGSKKGVQEQVYVVIRKEW